MKIAEVNLVKFDLLSARMQNIELQAQNLQLAHKNIDHERQALIALMRKEAGAPEGHVFNPQSREFVAPPTPAETPEKPKRGRKPSLKASPVSTTTQLLAVN